MSWLDLWERRAREAIGKPDAALQQLPEAIPQVPTPKPKMEFVWITTRRPREPGDLGEVQCGYYSVADGVVTMRDENGRPLGKSQALGPNDDARQIAWRLTREAWLKAVGNSDFNRPLHYQ